MDEADIAQRNQEVLDRIALEQHLAGLPTGEAAEECEDCGKPIPEGRRLAAPGCTRCIGCQERVEREKRGSR